MTDIYERLTKRNDLYSRLIWLKEQKKKMYSYQFNDHVIAWLKDYVERIVENKE